MRHGARMLIGGALVVAVLAGSAAGAAGEPAFVGSFGSHGTGSGQFDEPRGVAVGPDGSVYAADTYNDRVQRFTADGTYVRQFGSYGSANGRFKAPAAVAVASDGSVYVADTLNSRVQRFTADGSYVRQFGGPGAGDGELAGPEAVAVGPDGSVYVADTLNSRVQRFTADGTYVSQFGSMGSGTGQFGYPRGIGFGPDGSVFVGDWFNSRVQHFAADGTYVGQVGSVGFGNGQITSPTGVVVGPDGSVYVADTYNDRVQRFTADGTHVGQFGRRGLANGQLASPYGVAVGPDGSVYVSDALDRVQRFGDFGANLTPAAGQIGPVEVGAGVSQTLTLTNTASTALPLDAITIDGADAGQFVRAGGTCATTAALRPTASCTIDVTVTPTQAGTLSADVTVTAALGAWSGAYSAMLTATAISTPSARLPVVDVPAVSLLAPPNGPASGGTAVTITGANFTDGARVLFDGVPAVSVSVSRYDRLAAVAPAHPPGTVAVTVQTPAGISMPVVYTYIAEPPADQTRPAPATTTATPVICVVPDLRGRSLTAARQRLLAAHCALGRVRRTTSRRGGSTARVIAQTPVPGARRPQDHPVVVTIRTHR